MDASLLVAVIAVAIALAVAFVALRSRGQASDPELIRLAQSQSELVGSLKTLVDQSAAAQAATAERLQAQERALAKALEERFADITRRVGEHLEKSAQATSTTIGDLRERLVKIDEAQKSLAELSTHVVSLQDILSNKQARGAFGEEQLEAIVRDQLPPAHFEFQATLSNRMRVDCLLRLPPPLGPLCIDAKFPREAYDAMREAGSDEAARTVAQRAFATAITKHVSDIAEKYIIPGETAEAAMMFVPSEAVYCEIYTSTKDVADKARRSRVFIVSPTTLWAVLNTMRAILKDARMREQADAIQREVGLLLDDIGRLSKRVDNLESHFAAAEKDVREIRTSTEKIIRRGDRIQDVELDKPVPPLTLVPPAATGGKQG
ncbi:MAG TPA: DNA recombination protein RmuC [Alphaproteobacteria bacterium]|nr:DNA recombination protein RmuC [Alphaproteobacteria bacterium]